MKKITKKIITGALAISIIGTGSSVLASTYQVKSGDTFWKIASKYDLSTSELMKENNATKDTILYIGDKLNIPDSEENFYTVQKGDTPWIISNKFDVSLTELLSINNLDSNSYIYIGQKLKIPNKETIEIPKQPESYVTYETHIVKRGESFWSLSKEYGIQYSELLKANNAPVNTILYIGDEIKIPIHHVPVTETLGEKYGEYLDWWQAAQYVIPIGAKIKIKDLYTGKSFMAKRTLGANHADCETLTKEDTKIMKDIWGGSFNWEKRPVVVEYNGRKIAASQAGMPHAGNENVPGGEYTSWRNGGYGAGMNLDYIKGNAMEGHFDLHFLNSTRHKDGNKDETHQKNVKISAGIIK
ncbi:MAG: LysM peptidoglycan-binding domain-containing protein [Firmicutes bacterium]|nr:LysM peptidoglycan-binding domain-containing protein [Bacillota bacterium]